MTKIEVKKARNGKGIFAEKNFRPGETVMEIKGKLFHYRTLLNNPGPFSDNSFRFSEDYYLSPAGQKGDYLNHSCQPNSRVEKRGKKLYLIVINEISRGKEILLDYSTILTPEDVWTMKCNCGSRNCRKIIKEYGSLPQALKSFYLKENIIPKYIQKL